MSSYIPPDTVALGLNVDENGRRERHRAAPRKRDVPSNFDLDWLPGHGGESRFYSGEPSHRITLDYFTRRFAAAGTLTRFASLRKPAWPVGEQITVTRMERELDDGTGKRMVRDPALALVIRSIEPARLDVITQKTVRSFGNAKVTEFALRWMDTHDEWWQDRYPDSRDARPIDVLARWGALWQHRAVYIVRWGAILPHDIEILTGRRYSQAPDPLRGRLAFRPEDDGEVVEPTSLTLAEAQVKLQRLRDEHAKARGSKRAAYVSPSRRRLLEATK